MTETVLYDSAFHLDDIPDRAWAMLYGDGAITGWQIHYKWTRFAAVRWITVLGSPGCGAFDYEQGNDEAAVRSWCQGRHERGQRARLYCGGNNLRAASAALEGLPYLLWYPTLDGIRRTAAQLVEKILADCGILFPVERLWAHQWVDDGPVDRSELYGRW